MKYVLFLDILGTKGKLKSLKQKDAKTFIAEFSSTIYRSWIDRGYENSLDGYIISDSLIVNTKNASQDSLEALLDATVFLCRAVFSKNEALLRGAIAKGDFDRLKAKELSTLGKELIVGQAYIDAYELENSIKTSGIILSKDVHEDIKKNGVLKKDAVFSETFGGKKSFVLSYLNIDFLEDIPNLKKFILLANEANWLPHYYNTLYFAIKGKSPKIIDQLFNDIISHIDEKTSYSHYGNFIQNAFNENVVRAFKAKFLRFIINNLKVAKQPQVVSNDSIVFPLTLIK